MSAARPQPWFDIHGGAGAALDPSSLLYLICVAQSRYASLMVKLDPLSALYALFISSIADAACLFILLSGENDRVCKSDSEISPLL